MFPLLTDTTKSSTEASNDNRQGGQFTMNTGSAELDQFFSSTLAAASSHPDVTLTAVKKVEDSEDGRLKSSTLRWKSVMEVKSVQFSIVGEQELSIG